jgi:1-acyl-sn-glycerol-3-phosphate acyltransferase
MSRTTDHLKMTPFYGIFDYIIHCIYEAFFRGEVFGLEHIPESGPFLIAANHASHLDPPVIGSQIPRQMRFFARKTLWDSRVGNWWMTSTECIPVDRDGGDVGAIRRVLQALEANRAVVLFPEGTRSPDGRLQKPKAGVGLMACKTGVPVVPARVFNSFAAFGKGDKIPRFGTPISITFGAPITAAEYDDPSAGKERYQRASERIFARIAALQEPVREVI